MCLLRPVTDFVYIQTQVMAEKWTHTVFLLHAICLFSGSQGVLITTYGEFTENSTVTLACSIEQFTSAATWSNDNITPVVKCNNIGWCSLTTNPQMSVSANISGTYVVISPLTSAVKTEWYCSHNGIVAKVSITILAPPSLDPAIFTTPVGSVITGSTIKMTCEVTGGKPLAKINWDCAGAFNEQNTPTDGKAVSSVQSTVSNTDDGKVCRCRASHPLWTTNKTVDVVLNVLYAPDTTPTTQQSPPGPIFAGSKLKLTCTVSGGKPVAILFWDCNGTNTNSTSDNTASYSVELIVDETYNNRVCNCFATHPVLSYRPAVQHGFIVYYAPIATPSIQQSPQGPIIVGSKVTLTCTVSGGNPLATLSWDCNGTLSNNTSGNTASYSVEWAVDKTYNSRVCTCSATHLESSYRPAVQHGLIVYFAPDATPSIRQTPIGDITTGCNATLTCTVSGGNPLATLSWNCTGTATNNTLGRIASYSIELTLDSTYNTKMCTCLATHPVMSYRPAVHHRLVINYGPSEVRISPTTRSYTVKETEGSVGPIYCLADCNPECVIAWFGPHLSANMNILNLQSINKSQAGYYQCAASNILSSVLSAIVEVIVEWGPILNERILSSPQNISLNIGMMLNITISVTANPVPLFHWTFQHKSLIKNITEISKSSANGFQHTLSVIISAINATQFGTYTVFINNSIGYLNRSFYVIERDKPTLPNFIHVICKTKAATILWQSSYNGGAEQYFKVQFWKSGESTRTTQEQNISDQGFEFVQQYTVSYLSSDTNYWFTVLAINEIGFSSSKAVNCTTEAGHRIASSQERSELFVAAISAFVITIIVVVIFTIGCCLYRRGTTIKRSDNYVDLTTNHGSDDAYAYSTVQETEMGTQNMNREHFAADKQMYENCQPNSKTNDVTTYHNNIQITPPKKDVVYANMAV